MFRDRLARFLGHEQTSQLNRLNVHSSRRRDCPNSGKRSVRSRSLFFQDVPLYRVLFVYLSPLRGQGLQLDGRNMCRLAGALPWYVSSSRKLQLFYYSGGEWERKKRSAEEAAPSPGDTQVISSTFIEGGMKQPQLKLPSSSSSTLLRSKHFSDVAL